jgi:hypothetical protein
VIERVLFWLAVSEISVHGQLIPLLLDLWGGSGALRWEVCGGTKPFENEKEKEEEARVL